VGGKEGRKGAENDSEGEERKGVKKEGKKSKY